MYPFLSAFAATEKTIGQNQPLLMITKVGIKYRLTPGTMNLLANYCFPAEFGMTPSSFCYPPMKTICFSVSSLFSTFFQLNPFMTASLNIR